MSSSQIALLASVQQFLDRQHGLYIDGAPCAAQSENRLTVWDPATGQAIATMFTPEHHAVLQSLHVPVAHR